MHFGIVLYTRKHGKQLISQLGFQSARRLENEQKNNHSNRSHDNHTQNNKENGPSQTTPRRCPRIISHKQTTFHFQRILAEDEAGIEWSLKEGTLNEEEINLHGLICARELVEVIGLFVFHFRGALVAFR